MMEEEHFNPSIHRMAIIMIFGSIRKIANRMIVADDGGAQVSFMMGTSWSTYENQPTVQVYRVSTDNAFPYRILAPQQDNQCISE